MLHDNIPPTYDDIPPTYDEGYYIYKNVDNKEVMENLIKKIQKKIQSDYTTIEERYVEHDKKLTDEMNVELEEIKCSYQQKINVCTRSKEHELLEYSNNMELMVVKLIKQQNSTIKQTSNDNESWLKRNLIKIIYG
jgi:F0F1-type ATP synthase membrane subunit b/b'